MTEGVFIVCPSIDSLRDALDELEKSGFSDDLSVHAQVVDGVQVVSLGAGDSPGEFWEELLKLVSESVKGGSLGISD